LARNDWIAASILTFEGEIAVVWFEGSHLEDQADRKSRLGSAADQPHRIKYRQLNKKSKKQKGRGSKKFDPLPPRGLMA
jgi:hypothetical protein